MKGIVACARRKIHENCKDFITRITLLPKLLYINHCFAVTSVSEWTQHMSIAAMFCKANARERKIIFDTSYEFVQEAIDFMRASLFE